MLEKRVITGWWDNFILYCFKLFAYEVNVKHEISVRCALLAFDQDIVLQFLSREIHDCYNI